ncbi:MAG: cytochrome C oxidase subunit IV family protein [Actinomycetota bacterium]
MTVTAKRRQAEHSHPNPWRYVTIALILAAITAGEVALYYLKLPKPALVVMLIALSAVKFGMVAMFFMHLKFDAPIFRRLFLIGITLAFVVYVVVLLSLGILR